MDRPLRLAIVDDEPLAAERLQLLCGRMEDVRLVGVATDGDAALRLIDDLNPDVLLLDISMPGRDGLDVARVLAEREVSPRIVFITAFDRFAVAAFDVDAVDYVTKPVSSERLERALARARKVIDGGPVSKHAWLDAVWVPQRGEMVRIDTSLIDWIEAERDYMRLHLGDRSYLFHSTATALAERLDPAAFVRIHRSTIVRLAAVAGVRHDGHGTMTVQMTSGSELRVGRSFANALRAATQG